MMGVISEDGLRLAMLDTLRQDDERALQRAINRLSDAVDREKEAEFAVLSAMREVKALRLRLASQTFEMNRLVHRRAA